MRLIDADEIKYTEVIEYGGYGHSYKVCKISKEEVEKIPTVDPQTLQVVQELEEQLKRVSDERDTLKEKATSQDVLNLAQAFDVIQRNKKLGGGYVISENTRIGILDAMEETIKKYRSGD